MFLKNLPSLVPDNLNIICKSLAIIGFSLIFFDLVVITISPSLSGYEFSLYGAYPWIFWLFILSALFTGQLILLLAFLYPMKIKRNWVLGFSLIFLTDFILISLPLIRGYFINGSGDVLTHIGYMRDILTNSNYINNHYPLNHIFGVIIHYFSNLSIEKISIIIPLIFSCIYLIICIPVARIVLNKSPEIGRAHV